MDTHQLLKGKAMAYAFTHIANSGKTRTAYVCSEKCAKIYARENRVPFWRFETGHELPHDIYCDGCEKIYRADN
jgi:hypothetical protein